MADILLSAAARQNLRVIQDVTSMIAAAQKRLSTGKKVNSPFDNPASFFTASALNTRAAALNSVLDGINVAEKSIEAAKTGVESIQSLVANAQNLAQQALASPDTLAKFTGTVSGLVASTALTGIGTGKTITVSDGTTTAIYTDAFGNDVQDFLDAVNTTSGLNVTASLTTEGKIELKAKSTNSVTIAGTASTGELASIGLVAGTSTHTANATRQSYALQFDALRDQINQIVGDASYNGTNLLQGSSLTVNFNETGTSKATINGLTLSTSSLGISAVTSASGGVNFQTDAEINTAIAQLTSASSSLTTSSSSFSSNLTIIGSRQDFTESFIDMLQSGADDLVLSDPTQDGAELLALQARQQLALTALSMTQSSDSNVLRLFGLSG